MISSSLGDLVERHPWWLRGPMMIGSDYGKTGRRLRPIRDGRQSQGCATRRGSSDYLSAQRRPLALVTRTNMTYADRTARARTHVRQARTPRDPVIRHAMDVRQGLGRGLGRRDRGVARMTAATGCETLRERARRTTYGCASGEFGEITVGMASARLLVDGDAAHEIGDLYSPPHEGAGKSRSSRACVSSDRRFASKGSMGSCRGTSRQLAESERARRACRPSPGVARRGADRASCSGAPQWVRQRGG